MRTIKFRAWHQKANKMFSAEQMGKDQLTILPDTGQFINVSSVHVSQSQIIGDMIPMQFTGLRDKNGLEIYEGDILQDKHGLDHQVVWQDACYYMKPLYGPAPRTGCGLFHFHQTVEVIGNVYEMPELV